MDHWLPGDKNAHPEQNLDKCIPFNHLIVMAETSDLSVV